MNDLPAYKLYALRHGITGRVWEAWPGFWLFKSPKSLEQAWAEMKKAGLVKSEFHEHKIIIQLQENP